MADLTIYISEKININDTDRGVYTTQTISGINNVDNRILTCPTGSYTGLFFFDSSTLNPATFTTGSFKYGRITNRSNISAKLQVNTAMGSNETFLLDANSSFFLSNTSISASYIPTDDFVFNDYISEILVEPSGSPVTIEYFIATT